MRRMRASWLFVAATVLGLDVAAQVARADIANPGLPPVSTDRPRDVLHFMTPKPGRRALAAQADSHIIYLNNCLPNGCKVTVGDTDARVDTSDIASQTGVLSPFADGQAKWDATVACVRGVFSRFNVTITDVDPGMTPHYEVMVAGMPQEILGNNGFGVGGVADFPCQQVGQCDPYLPNALVFDFAGVFNGDVNELCAVAAQEIAHTWALDHVVDASDPLTYNQYSGVRQYHDAEVCGSDCQGGKSPFGLTCTGSGGKATHTCSGTGTATQDEVQMITALFGSSGPPTPPTVAITSPADGATVTPAFNIKANVTDDVGVAKVELYIDGSLIGTDSTAPYAWTAPTTLASGSHTIKVTGYDLSNTPASAQITVTQGDACKSAGDCMGTDTCVDGRCVPGNGAPGGLGTTCVQGTDCASGQCASDTANNHYCVESCDTTRNACPGGFSCIAAGDGGVCWPTGDNGDNSGGCSAGEGGGGPILAGFGLAALLLVTRRRRAASRA